jgi:hypothetical protein
MKPIRILFLILAFAALSFAQQAPQILTQTTGLNAPDPGACTDTNLHATYMQTGDPANAFAGEWICVQSTAHDFAWAAVMMLPPGTTGTHKTALVYPSFCGPTVGNATCANQTNGASVRTVSGIATLSSGSAVISGISPAFTGTSTFACNTTDTTTASNASKAVNTSTSSITITGTSADTISWTCSGY